MVFVLKNYDLRAIKTAYTISKYLYLSTLVFS